MSNGASCPTSIESIGQNNKLRYEMASKYCQDKIVLDCACGGGYGTFILSQNARKVCGYDIDDDNLKIAEQYWSSGNIVYKKVNVEEKNLLEQFDVIVSSETIEHLMMPINETLNLFKKHLNKSGILFLTFPENEIKKNECDTIYHVHFEIKSEEIIKILQDMSFTILQKQTFDDCNECFLAAQLIEV